MWEDVLWNDRVKHSMNLNSTDPKLALVERASLRNRSQTDLHHQDRSTLQSLSV